MKKGQLTVIIIVGLLILSLLVFLVFILTGPKNTKEGVPDFAMVVDEQVEECSRKSLKEALLFTSLQGGYYDVPPDFIDHIYFKVPYYFKDGEMKAPSKKEREEEFSIYLRENMRRCLDIDYLRNKGYELGEEEIEVSVELGETITAGIDYPLTISKDGDVYRLREKEIIHEFDYDHLYSALEFLIEEQKKEPNSVPIGSLSVLARKEGFEYELNYLNRSTLMYSLIFPSKEENVVLNFLWDYDWNLDLGADPLRIVPAGRKTAYEGVLFEYDFEVINRKEATFTDFSSILDISHRGEISFVPKRDDVGMHEILILARDEQGNEDTVILTLDIQLNEEEQLV